MKRPTYSAFLCIALSLPFVVCAQQDSSLVSLVLHRLEKATTDCDPCQYNAVMRFKYMNTDTFEIRNFTIRYRSNPDNRLYGYDWEVGEIQADGNTYTWMALPSNIYVMYSDNKLIAHFPLPETIEPGNYYETMRDYFILSENITPFVRNTKYPVTIVDSLRHYYLSRRINESATRMMVVSKENYLPVQYVTTISTDIGLTQILEVSYHFDDSSRILAAMALSPDYYAAAGYAEPEQGEVKPSPVEEKKIVTKESAAFLMNYAFVNASGDTTLIADSEAAYVVLDFWFASCYPCLLAMPTLNQLAAKYSDSGLHVFGINCIDKDASAYLTKKMSEKNISFPLLFGDADLVQTLGIKAYPTYVLITPERQVQFINGGIDDVEKTLVKVFGK